MRTGIWCWRRADRNIEGTELSSSTVLYIPIDVCGDYFSTSRMCSASCTSGLYLKVWEWVGRYAGGGLVRGVRPFFPTMGGAGKEPASSPQNPSENWWS
jgi:hypothetical protein